jgi:hypothetical protein
MSCCLVFPRHSCFLDIHIRVSSMRLKHSFLSMLAILIGHCLSLTISSHKSPGRWRGRGRQHPEPAEDRQDGQGGEARRSSSHAATECARCTAWRCDHAARRVLCYCFCARTVVSARARDSHRRAVCCSKWARRVATRRICGASAPRSSARTRNGLVCLATVLRYCEIYRRPSRRRTRVCVCVCVCVYTYMIIHRLVRRVDRCPRSRSSTLGVVGLTERWGSPSHSSYNHSALE